ncbi:MAG: XdhC/CoxI family protein [Bacteroidia bacterium]|nr:MAG: XdhC/CoxI family protein [Bacteroidia bacterium]
MRSIHHKILEQIRSGSGAALATLVRASGSTPQKPGSSALFGEQGLLAGTVGGGILEGEVQHIAESLMISGASDHFYFNLDSDQGSHGAICGGEAEVLIDATPSAHLSVLEKMEKSLSQRKDGYLLTGVSSVHNSGRNIRRYWISGIGHEDLPMDMDPAFKEVIKDHLKDAERYGFIEIDLSTIPHQLEMAYLEHIKPMPHLIIAGRGHIGKALAHLGSLLEFEVTVVDDRPEFASANHIPDADHLVVRDIGTAMGEIKYGPDTYVVIVTRGHKPDGEALRSCIGSDAAYIGMIGSSHKVGIVKKQFLDEQWATKEQWSAIHTPIGLDIASKTVQEIAISIAAQLVEVRNRKLKADAE